MRGLVVPVAAMMCWSAAAGELCADDWPRWRGPDGDGTWAAPALAERLPSDQLGVVWERPIGGGYAGVTVAGGLAYTMDRRIDPEVERILCFDAATGEERWAHTYAAEYGDLTYDSGPRASVTIHAGRAYTLGAVGHVHCLDAETGEVIWSVDTVEELGAERPRWGFAASPVIYRDTVIVQVGVRPVGCLIALDKQTGRVVWKADTDPAGYCTPMIVEHDGRDLMVLWSPLHVVGLSPATGEVHWKHPYEVRYGVSIASPIFHEGIVLVSSYWHGARALRLGQDGESFEPAWSDELELRALMSQPLYRDGYGYLLDRQHGLTCFEYASGEVVWTDENRMTPRGRNPQATMVWTGRGDRALVLNSDGELLLVRLNPDGYEELWRTRIVGETWAHPAYADRHVFARSDERIVCVKLPLEP